MGIPSIIGLALQVTGDGRHVSIELHDSRWHVDANPSDIPTPSSEKRAGREGNPRTPQPRSRTITCSPT